jgi:leucyl/phenylalanyl-tRNA--protein transferase
MASRLPTYLPAGAPLRFPDPCSADARGLVAVGGDLSPQRLLLAYGMGIFPWFERRVPPLWWCPDPRGVLPLESVHCSRRLARRLRQGQFTWSWNAAFERVMRACAAHRADGTWIIPQMVEAYRALHELGHAHSLEVWQGTELVGGLYGVQRGGLFAGESMFHRCADASKAALVVAARSLRRAGIELFDVQFVTDHLARMGAVEWPRRRYLARLAEVRDERVDLAGLEPSELP